MDQIKMDSVAPVSDVAYGTHVKTINYLTWFDRFKQILCYVYTYTRDITNCMPPVDLVISISNVWAFCCG